MDFRKEREMNVRRGEEEMSDLALPPAKNQEIRCLIEDCLHNLKFVQWVKLEKGSVDKTTEKMFLDMVVEIINTVSRCVYEVSQQPSPPVSRGSPGSGSQKSVTISERQVRECLGDTITQTFADVLAVDGDIRCDSATKVNTLVLQEVTERVNSLLSKSSSEGSGAEGGPPASKSPRLRKLVKHLVQMLKTFVSKMDCQKLRKRQEKDSTSPVPYCVTPVTPLAEEADGDVSLGSVEEMTDAISQILERQSRRLSLVLSDNEVSAEEVRELTTFCSMDTFKTASEIQQMIVKELGSEAEEKPKSPSLAQSRTSGCWRKVVNRIRLNLARRYVKESILRILERLRTFTVLCDKMALMVLMFTEVLDRIFPLEPQWDDEGSDSGTEEKDVYESIADKISSARDSAPERLSDVVLHQLELSDEDRFQCFTKIRAQMDGFFRKMVGWLKQQTEQQEKGTDLASDALSSIQSLAGLSEAAGPSQTSTGSTVSPPASFIYESPDLKEEEEAEPAVQAEGLPEPGWREVHYQWMVSGLVNKILKQHSHWTVSAEFVSSVTSTLKTMLMAEVSASDIAVKPSERQMKDAIQAVYQDLCKEMFGSGAAVINLVTKDPLIYSFIIDTVKRHLVTPNNAVKRFFKRAFRTVAKPFTACRRFVR